MKAKEIRNLGVEEIQQRIEEESAQLRQLQFQHAIAHIENPMLLRDKRRLVARLKTVLKERQQRQGKLHAPIRHGERDPERHLRPHAQKRPAPERYDRRGAAAETSREPANGSW